MYGLRYRGALDTTTQAELEGLVAALQDFLLKEHNEDGTHRPVESDLAPVPVGAVLAWMTGTPPEGWLICDGTAISRVTYVRLFKVIGTTYGTGDGTNTFNLPDLSGRFPLGKAFSGTGSTLAATGGALDHAHNLTADGDHTHTVAGHTHTIGSDGSHTHTGTTGSTSIAHVHALSNLQSASTSSLTGGTEVQSGTGVTVANTGHAHLTQASGAGVIDSDSGGGSHTHTISSDGSHTHSGATGSTGPSTDTQGEHDHGGETDGANPPYLVVNYIILAGR